MSLHTSTQLQYHFWPERQAIKVKKCTSTSTELRLMRGNLFRNKLREPPSHACSSPTVKMRIRSIIIRYIFSFVFIGRKPTTWPANNCLQISVLLQIMFCSCAIETTISCENGRSLPRPVIEWFDNFDQKNSDRMIKQLLNSVIAKYRDLSVSRRSIICRSLRLRQIIYLLAADKSWYLT